MWIFVVMLAVLAVAWLFREKLHRYIQPPMETSPMPRLPSLTALSDGVELGDGDKLNVLEGIGGDVKGRVFHVGARTVTIGRSQQNFVQTLDKKASRRHCQLKPTSAGMVLVDMGSSNGTKVNEESIDTHELADGDVIRIGEAALIYRRKAVVESDAGVARKAIDERVQLKTKAR